MKLIKYKKLSEEETEKVKRVNLLGSLLSKKRLLKKTKKKSIRKLVNLFRTILSTPEMSLIIKNFLGGLYLLEGT